jgi:hypothetical protein
LDKEYEMKAHRRVLGFLLMILLGTASMAYGGDAEQIRTERRAVIGRILIEFDKSLNSDSVYILDHKTKEKIWIESLKWLKGAFKVFVEKRGNTDQSVSLNGLVEYWTDGMIILRPENITTYKVLE